MARVRKYCIIKGGGTPFHFKGAWDFTPGTTVGRSYDAEKHIEFNN